MLRRPLDFTQYTSIAYTERLEKIGVVASIGTVGNRFDRVHAKSLFVLIVMTNWSRNPASLNEIAGHRKGLVDLEFETVKRVSWFNGELNRLSQAEVEANYANQDQASVA